MSLIKRYFQNYRSPGGTRELLIIALPMMISTACDGVMIFTGRFFMAQLGSEQMNAVLGGGITMQTITAFFLGLTGYSTALVARYFGAGEKHKSPIVTTQTIIIIFLAWPLIILLRPVAEDAFRLMGISAVQLAYQVEYVHYLAIGSICGMLRYALGCYFSGIGRTRIVMIATFIAMITNIFFDYVLIFGKFGFPALGISGAAIGTIVASFCAVLVLLAAYFSKTNMREFAILRSFRFNWQIMKNLLHFGYPAGLEFFLNFLAFTIITGILHSQGDIAATATSIMYSWDLVSYIPLLGIEISVTSLVGRYMGARNIEAASQAAYSGIKTGILYSFVILVLFIGIPETLVYVFEPENPSEIFNQAVPIAVHMVRITSFYVLAEALMVALIGTLRGAGDTFFTMVASVASHVILIPILYVALKVFNFSVETGWALLVVCFLLFCVVLAWRYKQGKWKTIEIN